MWPYCSWEQACWWPSPQTDRGPYRWKLCLSSLPLSCLATGTLNLSVASLLSGTVSLSYQQTEIQEPRTSKTPKACVDRHPCQDLVMDNTNFGGLGQESNIFLRLLPLLNLSKTFLFGIGCKKITSTEIQV
ncbi:uncharacterized protein [Emydura macquarii macquarii]|uniref:uncharacterized protein n=1 Tax=Emydura macquarii macquarii TaxID=1129001 RepID=UPI003529EC84